MQYFDDLIKVKKLLLAGWLDCKNMGKPVVKDGQLFGSNGRQSAHCDVISHTYLRWLNPSGAYRYDYRKRRDFGNSRLCDQIPISATTSECILMAANTIIKVLVFTEDA